MHHSASDPNTTTVQTVHGWHLAKGWAGIGYHYFVDVNGGIWKGRPENKIGAHAYQDAQHEANSNGIGICLAGDFTSAQPTAAQMNSLVALIQDIQSRYGNGLAVLRHSDVMATACPGKSFPWSTLTARLSGQPSYPSANVISNGKKFTGVNISGTVYAPVRSLAESFGFAVQWDDATNTVLIATSIAPVFTEAIKINLGSHTIPAKMIRNTAYMSVRQFANFLGKKVGWDAATSTVTVQ